MAESEVLLEAGTNELEIIEFFIHETTSAPGTGAEPDTVHFGVNVAKVLEVIELTDHTPPSSPPHPSFMGTIPLRDRILPLIDLSVCLGMRRAPTNHEVVLVTEFNKRTTGFLVSGVTRIFRLAWSEVQPPNRYLANLPSNCVTGTAELEGHFTLLLDLERLVMELSPVDDSCANVDARAGGRSYRVLVAEDSTSIRELVCSKMQEANFETVALQNGEEAWKRLAKMRDETGNEELEFDAVISDIEMPAMDGYTLTKRIKQDRVLGRLPVVLFSSLITEELRHKGESVGADDQISKPEFGTLASRVLSLIEAAQA